GNSKRKIDSNRRSSFEWRLSGIFVNCCSRRIDNPVMVSADENPKISQSKAGLSAYQYADLKIIKPFRDTREIVSEQTRRRDEMVPFTTVLGVYLNRPSVS